MRPYSTIDRQWKYWNLKMSSSSDQLSWTKSQVYKNGQNVTFQTDNKQQGGMCHSSQGQGGCSKVFHHHYHFPVPELHIPEHALKVWMKFWNETYDVGCFCVKFIINIELLSMMIIIQSHWGDCIVVQF